VNVATLVEQLEEGRAVCGHSLPLSVMLRVLLLRVGAAQSNSPSRHAAR
jgi:hypothetical protein